jgi:lipoprotein-anchoring transpeptidase ErfK/SrfK
MFDHEPKARRTRARIAAAVATAFFVFSSTLSASAQGLFNWDWGGEPEWGGKRSVVSFDKKYNSNQIIVSFGDRRLYLITKPGQAISYPIAVPREQSRWSGVTTVSMKRENPDWTPTPEMIRENPRLPSWVPGGHPMNPLGVRALYLGASTYRIHGTDAPWTIGQAVSKGCIRMFNEDVLDLYPRVPVGMKVTVTWNRFRTGEPGEIIEAEAGSSKVSKQNTTYTGGFLFGGDGPAYSPPAEKKRVIRLVRKSPDVTPVEQRAEAE